MYPSLTSLNALKVFDAAARLGSFKKAAEELFITPTAVSHQIKSLEDALDSQLFERKTRAIQLTKEGRLLAETTSRIFQQLAETIGEIANSNRVISVSTTSSFAALWLVPHLERFYQQYPDIEISISTGEQIDDIERHRHIDIAIRYGEFDPKAENTTRLITESVGMYATPNYLSTITDIEQAQLLETKWINQSLTPFSWKYLLGDLNKNLTIRQYDQEHHVIQAALASQGIALVSSLLVQNALQNKWLVPYKNTDIKHKANGLSYYAVTPSRNINNKSVTSFLGWLTEEIK
ncbi:LysR substrate-binding domain-containing protein [Microbulbifer sp. CnH-101-G]|uniref:LysR substrate-binding domain-containing protein n=1 Tax=Microbulbifer sp. CnH-101-G TaxID=3243393 RepID=UPI00403A4383